MPHIGAVRGVENESAKLNAKTCVVDAKKCKMYMKNFGEFFINQVEHASCIVLSHTATAKLSVGNHKLYHSQGPYLTAVEVAMTSKPEEEIATLY